MKKTLIFALVCLMTLSLCLVGCGKEETERYFSNETSSYGGGVQNAYTLGSSTVNQKTMIYLHVNGSVQGEIKSIGMQREKEGTVPVNEFSEGFAIPTDKDTGLPVGARVHAPVTFIHVLDNTSPMFRRAAVTGERLTVSADFYTFNGAGIEERYFVMNYTNAIIVDIGTFTDARGVVYESVSFTFDGVTYTSDAGNCSYSDRVK